MRRGVLRAVRGGAEIWRDPSHDVGVPAEGKSRRSALVPVVGLLVALAFAAGVLIFTRALSGREGTSERSAFNAQTPVVKRLVDALKDDSPGALYGAFSGQARAELTRAEFTRTYTGQKRRTGPVTEASVEPPFHVRNTAEGAIASAVLRIGYQKSAAKDYSAYFLFEDGDWRFWFTGAAGSARRRAER